MFFLFFLLPMRGVDKNPELFNGEEKEEYVDYSNAEYVKDEVIVKFRLPKDKAELVIKNMGCNIVKYSHYLNYFLVKIPDGDVLSWVNKFRNMEDVVFAEPNLIYHAYWTPNDTYFSYQWHFDKNHIDMPAAWDIEKGGKSSVVVGIIDSGVAFEDYPIPAYEQSEVISDDGNYHKAPDLGGTNFTSGYDFIHNDTHPNDQNGHGTHVCGTIAQTTNNNTGVAGIAFNSTIMPVQVLNNKGSGPLDVIADGITWAVDHGADVLNLSLGGSYPSSLLESAVQYADNNGVVVVAATGNDNSSVGYPARYEECIAVGATDYNNERSYYSNYGTGIDIVAPGGDVRVDKNGDGYSDGVLQQTFSQPGSDENKAKVDEFSYLYFQGTSMAAPHVTGVVALMLAHGFTDVDDIKEALYSTAKDLGTPGYDEVYGHGLIQPAAALNYQGGGTEEKKELKYDDGTPDNFFYLDVQDNNKFAVRFTPTLSAPYYIDSAKVYVYDAGTSTKFRLTINNKKADGYPDISSNLAGPETFTTPGDLNYYYEYKWSLSSPVKRTNSSDFFVVFHYVAPDYGPPYLGGDTLSVDGRSYGYTASEGWGKINNVDLYIRAYIRSSQGVEEIVDNRGIIGSTIFLKEKVLHLNNLHEGSRVYLLSSDGRVIDSYISRDGNLNMSLPFSGVYFILIKYGEYESVRKVILSQ